MGLSLRVGKSGGKGEIENSVSGGIQAEIPRESIYILL